MNLTGINRSPEGAIYSIEGQSPLNTVAQPFTALKGRDK